jgi:hypothetical protein
MKKFLFSIGIFLFLGVNVFAEGEGYSNYGRFGGQTISTITWTVDKRNNGAFEISNPTNSVKIILSTNGYVNAPVFNISVSTDAGGKIIFGDDTEQISAAISASSSAATYVFKAGDSGMSGDFSGANSIEADSFKLGSDKFLHNPGTLNLFLAPVPNITTPTRSVIIGNTAGDALTDGDRNILIGSLAGQAITSGDFNTIVGADAGGGLTTDQSACLFGRGAGASITSSNDIFGALALDGLSSGQNNSAFGNSAGGAMTSGDYNCLFGFEAGTNKTSGSNNVIIGTFAGLNNSTGGSNVFIGYNAGRNEAGSNKLYIENSDSASPLIGGDFSANTVDINGEMDLNSNKILSLSTPTADFDAATKKYVDDNAAGAEYVILFDGTGNSMIYNSSSTAKLYGTWWNVYGENNQVYGIDWVNVSTQAPQGVSIKGKLESGTLTEITIKSPDTSYDNADWWVWNFSTLYSSGTLLGGTTSQVVIVP